jgi:GAF domain-containing protein/HAMP domain-containing protein
MTGEFEKEALMMNNPVYQPRKQPGEMTTQLREAFRAALVRIGGDLVFFLILFMLAFQSGAWQLFASAGSIAITLILAVIGAGLIRRGRVERGAWLVILGLFPTILLSVVFVSGLGLIVGVVVVLLTVTTAAQTLPAGRVGWAVVASVGVGIATLLLDLFGPTTDRLPVPPTLQTITPIVAGVMVLVLAIFTARQFANYSLRTKLIIGFVTVGALTAGLIIVTTNYLTRRSLTDVANQTLLAAARQTANNFDNFIRGNLEDISVEAKLPPIIDYLNLPAAQRAGSLEEAEAVAVLQILSRKENPYLSSYALLDRQGRDLLDTYTTDIGADKSDRDYFQAAVNTGQAYVSPVRISETTGNPSFYFSIPVRNTAAEIIGVMRVRYDATALQQIIRSQNEQAGKNSYAILLDERQIYLAHGTTPTLKQKSVAIPDPAVLAQLQAERYLPDQPTAELTTNIPDFAQALTNAAAQPYFTGYIGGTEVEQVAITPLQTQPWQVAFAQPVEVFLEPVATQTRNTTFLALGIVLGVAGLAFGLGQYLTRPIVRLTEVAQRVSEGDLTVQAMVETHDEVGQLAKVFNSMTQQLHASIGSLEDQVRERTAELALSIEVGQRAAAIRELNELLPTITEFIREQFNLYYTQVYFLDDLSQNLILEAGTGKAGQELLARRHSLPVGVDSIVGRVAVDHRSIVVPDTQNSDIHKANPLLPETRSELAIPLMVEEQVVGVLDLQADKVNTFTESNKTVFEAMATQLATAIDSAWQWALSQEAHRKADEALRQLTREGWAERLASHRESLGFAYDLSRVLPLSESNQKAPNGGAKLAVPVVVQNEPIGQLAVEIPSQRTLSTDEQGMLTAVAQQLAQKVENLRLFEQTQQRATREQIARQIVDKIRASRDIESALKTAAEELAKNLGVARAIIDLRLAPVDEPAVKE